jgi:hypothetical protein
MFQIEPCCTQKQWPALRDKIGAYGTRMFHGFGDLSIAELLPVALTRYADTPLLFVCPSLPNAAAEVLAQQLNKTIARRNGKGTMNVISRLTLITDLSKKKSPAASKWLTDNPYGDRLQAYNIQQNDTAIIFPDFAVWGNVNINYNGHFTALVTSNQRVINNLRETYIELIKRQK